MAAFRMRPFSQKCDLAGRDRKLLRKRVVAAQSGRGSRHGVLLAVLRRVARERRRAQRQRAHVAHGHEGRRVQRAALLLRRCAAAVLHAVQPAQGSARRLARELSVLPGLLRLRAVLRRGQLRRAELARGMPLRRVLLLRALRDAGLPPPSRSRSRFSTARASRPVAPSRARARASFTSPPRRRRGST